MAKTALVRPGRERSTRSLKRWNLESVLFGALLALIFVLPLFWGSNRNPVWLMQTVGVYLLLSTAALALPAAAWSAMWRQYRLPLALLAAWLGFNVVQLVPWPFFGAISNDVFQSTLTTLQSFFYAGLFVLTALFCQTPRRIRMLVMSIIVATLAQALFGALMTLSGKEWLLLEPKQYGIGFATGTFVNRNHFAGLLLTGLALGVGLLVGNAGRTRSADTWNNRVRDFLHWVMGPAMRLRLMLVVMVIGLVLSHSRMGNGAFFLTLFSTSALALVIMRPLPKKVLLLLSTLVIIDVLLVGSWFGFEEVVQRLQGTGQFNEVARVSADSDRLNISKETLAAANDFFWLGSGGGTFEQIFPAYRPVDLRKTFDHAHNDWLELLLEYGVVGFLLLVSWGLTGLWSAVKAMGTRRNPLMKGVGFGVVMALSACVLQGLVDFNLHIPACAAYLTITVALGTASLNTPTISGKSV
ncbi:MAG: O-antigen ligase family protein [Lysobacterales bacterium]